MFAATRNSLSNRSRKTRGAVSTEYIIILVLLAIAGIIGFMLLSTQGRQLMQNSIGKLSGEKTTYNKTSNVNASKDRMAADTVDMTGAENGAAEGDITPEQNF